MIDKPIQESVDVFNVGFTIDSHKPLNWLELLSINDSVIPYFENKEVEEVEGE